MRFATWNIERLNSSARRNRVLRATDDVAADVWVLTETDDAFAPVGLQYLHTSVVDETRLSKERWVSIASRFPLEPIALTGDPIRSAAARIHPVDGDSFVVFGTVLPWPSDLWGGMRGSTAFASALETQLQDLRALRGQNARSEFIWAGDFNQHLGEGARYSSRRNGDLLVEALRELGLHVLTADPDPVMKMAPARRSVDHICVAIPEQWDRQQQTVWPNRPTPDPRLSDHYGVAVDSLASRP